MSTPAPSPAPAPATTSAAARRAPLAHTTRWLLSQHLRAAAWTIGLTLAAAFVVLLVGDALWETDVSVVQWARQAFIWFPFSVAIMVTSAVVPAAVAAGLTRRTLGRASLVVALAMGVLYAAALTAALQLERAVVGTRGWAQQAVDDSALFADTSQVGWMVVDLLLVLTAAQVCGLLVTVVYQRAGGWWGTLALPLTVGPLLVVTPLLTTHLLDPVPTLARLPLPVLLLALAGWAFTRVLRGLPVRPATG